MKTREEITIEEEYCVKYDEKDPDVIELKKAHEYQTHILRYGKQYIVFDLNVAFLPTYAAYIFKLRWVGK